MGSCIICGASVDGRVCNLHEEDVVFEFRGNQPEQLTPNRYYRGTVDGFADFGIFVDIGDSVTGLLHRSELDQRLESVDLDSGDTLYVQVQNVRDNGNIDLGWSIRQDQSRFRGALVDDPDTEGQELLKEAESEESSDDVVRATPDSGPQSAPTSTREREESTRAAGETGESEPESDGGTTTEAVDSASDDEPVSSEEEHAEGNGSEEGQSDARTETPESQVGASSEVTGASTARAPATERSSTPDDTSSARSGAKATVGTDAPGSTDSVANADAEEESQTDETPPSRPGAEPDAAAETTAPTTTTDLTPTTVTELDAQVGDTVRLEGEIVGLRQTSGPTIFELRDETGQVECAAFEEAGVRAYPEVEMGDIVRLDGEVERRRGELQVETEAVVVLEGEEQSTVADRMTEALHEQAKPDSVELLADDPLVEALRDDIEDTATAIRRAVLEGRPVVVRHAGTVDGYVAGAALERATLPLVREHHGGADAEYHQFERRPVSASVYDMDDATRDVTRMLSAQDRHDEPVPLFVFVAAGSMESLDGFDLLDIYDARTVVIDEQPVDDQVSDAVDVSVVPDAPTSATVVASSVAATTNPDCVEDIAHLPGVSFWTDLPDAYHELAQSAGYDVNDVTALREALALAAHYQSYEDKRELVADLLFTEDGNVGLAEQVSEQYRAKMDTAVETARANIERETVSGHTILVLDTEAYTHRYEFPPTSLLLDVLHRRTEEADAIVGLGKDECHVRTDPEVAIRRVVQNASDEAPDAGLDARGARAGRIEFLAGERKAAREAILRSLGAELPAPEA